MTPRFLLPAHVLIFMILGFALWWLLAYGV